MQRENDPETLRELGAMPPYTKRLAPLTHLAFPRDDGRSVPRRRQPVDRCVGAPQLPPTPALAHARARRQHVAAQVLRDEEDGPLQPRGGHRARAPLRLRLRGVGKRRERHAAASVGCPHPGLLLLQDAMPARWLLVTQEGGHWQCGAVVTALRLKGSCVLCGTLPRLSRPLVLRPPRLQRLTCAVIPYPTYSSFSHRASSVSVLKKKARPSSVWCVRHASSGAGGSSSPFITRATASRPSAQKGGVRRGGRERRVWD